MYTNIKCTPWSTVLLQKPADSLPVRKFPAFYGTAFTKSPPPIPNPEPDQSSPFTPSHFLKIILILHSHLSLVFSSGLFPTCFPIETLYAPLFSPICYMPHPSHSCWYEHPNNIWWGIVIIKLLVMLSFMLLKNPNLIEYHANCNEVKSLFLSQQSTVSSLFIK